MRARTAPSVTLSSLPGQPDITPIFPRYGMIYYGRLVRYLAAQVKAIDWREWGTGRSGRGTAVSDPNPFVEVTVNSKEENS
jgi:hypothetical protein